jgi:hypothetical protein
MDSVQFALALDRYDVTIHQPHPPGYFLYVMLGRFVNIFIRDANTVFVSISILFSGLTVVAIYFLGKELYNHRTGFLAALIALTSPCLWFHGEVALTYAVEAFFSTITAFLCWKVYAGKHHYICYSALVLGIAGGIRQNSLIFLFPLWLFCIKGVQSRKIIISFVVIFATALLWLIPMILMTGGLDAYMGAFRELWRFNTGNNSVFEQGWPVFKYYSSTLFDFTFYGLGAGLFIVGLAIYSLVRNGKLNSLDRPKIFFFSFWILPSIMFYLLIFIHPANPGYALIYLPAFFILTAASVTYITTELSNLLSTDLPMRIITTLIVTNVCIFFFSNYPVSYRKIVNHGRELEVIIAEFRLFDPSVTEILTGPYIFWGYRQIMYYLPEYRVYQIDYKTAPSGEIRKTFWGINRKTFLTDGIALSTIIKDFALLVTSEDKNRLNGIKGLKIKEILPYAAIASGPVIILKQVYPEMNF